MPKFEEFRLPDVGEGLTESDIVSWQVAVGDEVEVNQVLCEIETAKSLVELPSPHTGVVTQLLASEGDTVPVGDPIIVIDTDPAGEPDDPPADATTTAATGADVPPADVAFADASRADATTTADGAADRQGEADGDRVDTSVEDSVQPAGAGADGEGVAVTRGASTAHRSAQHLSTQDHRTQSDSNQSDSTPSDSTHTSSASTPSPRQSGASGGGGSNPVLVGYGAPTVATSRRPRRADSANVIDSGASPHPVLAKPPVRALARELGLDLSRVRASGPGGIITREDLLAAAKAEEPRFLATYPDDEQPWLDGGKVSADGRQTRVPVRSVRRRTAEAMVTSAFTAPHVTVFTTVDVTRSMRMVEGLRRDREFADVRVTPLLIAAKALILAVRRHPQISAAWDEEAQEIVFKHYVNLGIAAATPRGLVVPNIKDAHRLTLLELAEELQSLTRQARSGKSTPASMQDGTITITNVGVFGISTGTPILNPGESAILAFGSIDQRPWVHKGKVKPRWVTDLALSFDHRLVDGELGSRVLADVAKILEDPGHALVWG